MVKRAALIFLPRPVWEPSPPLFIKVGLGPPFFFWGGLFLFFVFKGIQWAWWKYHRKERFLSKKSDSNTMKRGILSKLCFPSPEIFTQVKCFILPMEDFIRSVQRMKCFMWVKISGLGKHNLLKIFYYQFSWIYSVKWKGVGNFQKKTERKNDFSPISDEDLSKILILGTNFIIFDHRFRKHGCLDGKLKWSFLIKNGAFEWQGKILRGLWVRNRLKKRC